MRSKTVETTWLGQRGRQVVHHLDSRPTGHRIIVHEWLEDGGQGKEREVTVRRVRGDAFRNPETFEEFSKVTFHNPEPAAVARAVDSAAADFDAERSVS